MNKGFLITLGGRKVALFSLARLPEDKSGYLADGADLLIFVTPSLKYDFRADVYNTSFRECMPNPDALAAIGIFFLKIRGLPLPELEIDLGGIPVRIKLALIGDNYCRLSLAECKLLSTKMHTTEAGIEVKLTTALFFDRIFLRLMRTEKPECVRASSLAEFNFISGLADTVCTAAYSLGENGVDLILTQASFFSSSAALAALELARGCGGALTRRCFSSGERRIEAEVFSSGEVGLFFDYSVDTYSPS